MIEVLNDVLTMGIALLILIANTLLCFKVKDLSLLKISSKKIISWSLFISFFLSLFIIINIPGNSDEFIEEITQISYYLDKMSFGELKKYDPHLLLIIYFIRYGVIAWGEIFLRIINLTALLCLQTLLLKISFLIIEKNESRKHFKSGLILLSTSFILIFNIIFVNNLELIINCFFYLGVYFFLKKKKTLAGLVFGFMALINYDFLLFFFGLLIFMIQKDRETMKRMILPGLMVIIFTSILVGMKDGAYLYNSYVWQDQPQIAFDINILKLLFISTWRGSSFVYNMLLTIIFSIYVILSIKFMRKRSSVKTIIDLLLLVYFLRAEINFTHFIFIFPLFNLGYLKSKNFLRNMYLILNFLTFSQILFMYYFYIANSGSIFLIFLINFLALVFIGIKIVVTNGIFYIIWIYDKPNYPFHKKVYFIQNQENILMGINNTIDSTKKIDH